MLCSDDFRNMSPFINKNGLVTFCTWVFGLEFLFGEMSTNTKRQRQTHTDTHTHRQRTVSTLSISNARLQCPPQAVSVNQTCDVFQSASAAKLQSSGPWESGIDGGENNKASSESPFCSFVFPCVLCEYPEWLVCTFSFPTFICLSLHLYPSSPSVCLVLILFCLSW